MVCGEKWGNRRRPAAALSFVLDGRALPPYYGGRDAEDARRATATSNRGTRPGIHSNDKSMKNLLVGVILVLTLGLVLAYHDTDVFQGTMKRLFTPDPSMAAPVFWQEVRLWILGGMFFILAAFYIPVWLSARSLIRTYRQSPANPERPEVSALQAGFLYLRSQPRTMVGWLIDRCREGSLSLHLEQGLYYPWSVSRGRSSAALSEADGELVAMLLRNDDSVFLRPVVSGSNPPVRETSARLFRQMKAENERYCRPRRSSLYGWLFLAALLLEVPSYNALDQNHPALIALALLCAATFALPFYAFCRQLPALFSGSITSVILVVASVAFAMVVPMMVFNGWGQHYLPVALLPSLAAALAVSVYRLPFALNDGSLLSRIIGYQKALAQGISPIDEEEIGWNLALGVHTDIFEGAFSYAGKEVPHWLTSSEEDVQVVMKSLHQTIERSVTRAIYGEQRSRRSGTGGGGFDRH
jgi:hypothetical protein